MMKSYSLLYVTFALTILLGFVHFVAESLYLYWTVWWFDNIVHALAGFTLGFFIIWFLFYSSIFYKRSPTILESILNALLYVIIIGIGWEIFEYVNGITQSTEGYTLDIVHDLIADALGAILAGIIGSRGIFRTTADPTYLQS